MELNILVRGQSNAQILVSAENYTGGRLLVREVQRLLGFDGGQDKVSLIYSQAPEGPATVRGGTGFMKDWLRETPQGWQVGRMEQALLDHVRTLPSTQRDDPTAVLWLHSEYDTMRADLTVPQWEAALRFDAAQLRATLGQPAATTPYYFISAHPFPLSYEGSTQVVRQAMESLAADPAFNARIAARALDLNTDWDNPDRDWRTREYGGHHISAADAYLLAQRAALSIAEGWAPYARPGSPVAQMGGDVGNLGPQVVAARRAGPASLEIDVRHDRAAGFLPLGEGAAAGLGWSARLADGGALQAIHATLLDADTLRLDFEQLLPDAGGTLHYGWGYGRLAWPGGPGQGNAAYDGNGLPIWVAARGLSFGGGSPVPLAGEAEALQYIAAYPDLIAAFGADAWRGAVHLASWGLAGGRTSRFDGLGYLAANPDLYAVLGGDPGHAAAHWIRHGRAEGRTEGFDLAAYAAGYDDLATAFGTDAAAALRHWVEHGRAEGRTPRFDGLDYLATHADLAAAYGADAHAGALHWLAHGRAEGRAPHGFDAARYLANYADLRQVFGDDLHAATRHYLAYGRGEGRVDDALWA